MPRRSVLASIYSILNGPAEVLIFQRGSVNSAGDGWCMPDIPGQIDSHAVFRFLEANDFPLELTVLWEPAAP